MYTQCSKCETVFRLSADVLRAAGGQVRCGRCGDVFNALARLAEDSTGFAGGESPLDLETRADSILQSVSVPRIAQNVANDAEDFGPPGVEIAHLEVLDWPEADATRSVSGAPERPTGADAGARSGTRSDSIESLEFTLPPGELDRIFVDSKTPAPKPAAAAPPVPQPAQSQTPQPLQTPQPERRARFEIPEVSDDVRRDMLEGIEQGLEPAAILRGTVPRPGARRAQLALWVAAAIGSVALLALQIGRNHREWFGAPLASPANLASYQLRQWGVTGDPDANGTLRVRASILNTAAQLRAYPLLRVTLADRFGKRIGTRDFEPSEYVGKPTARLLAPGEQVDANLQILDPGKNAEGFEIDLCMRAADQHIACTADVAAQSKR